MDATTTPPLNKRQQNKVATRAKAVAAARTLFEADGYADTTIRDIAKAMDMSTGAIFANFEDKAALWSAVFSGPAPDLAIADEIARTLGELPGHGWALSCHDGKFQATLCSADFDPIERQGRCYGGKGETAAIALRQAREAAAAGDLIDVDGLFEDETLAMAQARYDRTKAEYLARDFPEGRPIAATHGVRQDVAA